MAKEIQEEELADALEKNRSFLPSAIVLERNENSELLAFSKECSKEFFERVFAPEGPLWQTYVNMFTGFAPVESKHLNFIAGRMYFCRNVEKRFMRSAGTEKEFFFKDGKLTEEAKISPKNILLLLASPFEMLSQVMDISLLPVYVDEKMRKFSEFRKETIAFYEQRSASIGNPVETAEKALANAVKAMEYSFVASLAASLKAKIADSEAWKECEAEELFEKAQGGERNDAVEKFGFHSESPYDISVPRLKENSERLKFAAVPAPKNSYARWRENAKFLCSRHLCIMRETYQEIGNERGMEELIFNLRTEELEKAIEEPRIWKETASRRGAIFEKCASIEMGETIVFDGKKWNGLKEEEKGEIAGTSAGSGNVAEGVAVFINESADYSKNVSGRIIISKTLSPNLAILFKSAKAVISEGGGVLAHSAIMARETEIPCVIRTKNFSRIKEGQKLIVDGKNGKIRLA